MDPQKVAALDKPVIDAADRVPFWQKVAFSLGQGKDGFANFGVGTLYMPFYNIALGINPALLGAIMTLKSILEAFTDPLAGHISDNTRTRWGRRRPYIVIFAVLVAITSPFILFPPANLSVQALIWFLVLNIVVRVPIGSMWGMPYFALQMEMTPNYDERTRITSYMTLIGKIYLLANGWVLAFATCRWFIDPLTQKPDIIRGSQAVVLLAVPLIILTGVLPGIFVKERYYEAEASHQKKESFWTNIKESARCRPLWPLIGLTFLQLVGCNIAEGVGRYLNIFLVSKGHIDNAGWIEGWRTTAMVVAGMVSIPFWTWVSEKLDKTKVVGIVLVGAIAGHLLNLFCLRPDMPYLQIVPAVFYSGVSLAIWLMFPSMKADVADWDELQTGRRREGSINAFYSWFVKAALAVATAITGAVLAWTGLDAKLAEKIGETPEPVLHKMMVAFMILPIAIWTVCLVFLRFYPLNRHKMAVIRAELEARRGRI